MKWRNKSGATDEKKTIYLSALETMIQSLLISDSHNSAVEMIFHSVDTPLSFTVAPACKAMNNF